VGHSGNIEHIDWSLPISLPGSKLHGCMIIQVSDASGNLLNWNPKNGEELLLPASYKL
jgi:microtubule-associated protein-like 5